MKNLENKPKKDEARKQAFKDMADDIKMSTSYNVKKVLNYTSFSNKALRIDRTLL